jgi:hypothetical protein
LNEAAKARLAHLPGAENVQRVKKSNVSYKSQEKFPNDSEVNECKIFVGKWLFLKLFIRSSFRQEARYGHFANLWNASAFPYLQH